MIYLHLILIVIQKKISFSVGQLCLALILILVLVMSLRGCGRPKPLQDPKQPELTNVTHTNDRKGTEIVQVKQEVYTKEDMRKITDSLRKVLPGRPTIKEVTKTVVRVDTVVKAQYIYVDTINHTIDARDSTRYFKMSFKGSYSLNTGVFGLKLTNDTISYITAQKHHLFKATENEVFIYHTNKLYETTVGSSFTTKIPKPIVVVSIGPYYDLFRNQWGACISAGFPIIIIHNKK